MTERVVIRAHGQMFGAVIVAFVFGGLASLGLRVVIVAFQLGEAAPWVWGLLALCLAFLWAVIHALWHAFGVSLVISRAGIRKPGPFRGLRLPAEGLRLGRYDTVRGNFGSGGQSTRMRATKITQFWARSPQHGSVLLWDGPRDAPQVARIETAAAALLQLAPAAMSEPGADGFRS